MPTRCCIAPETPRPRYSAGFTTRPVWPIWRAYGIQPASTTARVAPDDAAEQLRQLVHDAEALRAADAATADDDDARLLERDLGTGLGDAVEDGEPRGRRAVPRSRGPPRFPGRTASDRGHAAGPEGDEPGRGA